MDTPHSLRWSFRWCHHADPSRGGESRHALLGDCLEVRKQVHPRFRRQPQQFGPTGSHQLLRARRGKPHQGQPSTEKVFHALSPALVGDMGHGGAGFHREQLADQVLGTAHPAGAESDCLRVGLRIGQQCRNVIHRQVFGHHREQRRRHHQRHRRQVFERVVRHVLVDQPIDCVAIEHHQQGVAVRRGLGYPGPPDSPAGPDPVFYHDGLAQRLAELLLDHAGDAVYSATGRERHDEMYRPVRVLLSRCSEHRCQADKSNDPGAKFHGWSYMDTSRVASEFLKF